MDLLIIGTSLLRESSDCADAAAFRCILGSRKKGRTTCFILVRTRQRGSSQAQDVRIILSVVLGVLIVPLPAVITLSARSEPDSVWRLSVKSSQPAQFSQFERSLMYDVMAGSSPKENGSTTTVPIDQIGSLPPASSRTSTSIQQSTFHPMLSAPLTFCATDLSS